MPEFVAKLIKHLFVTVIFVWLSFPHFSISQERFSNELHFEINPIYPYFSITKDELKTAQTLIDLNEKYQSSWIKEYISVEIITLYRGQTKTARSKNDTLSQKQKDLITVADSGTDIAVVVQYIPDNTLSHNEIKVIDFKLAVLPQSDAKYPGGVQQLRHYLKENALSQIPDSTFQNLDLATVKFTIDNLGQVVNAHIFWPFKDEKIDTLLLNAIRCMPNWSPASYSDGTKIKQEFAFTVGNMENCVVNLLGIRKN